MKSSWKVEIINPIDNSVLKTIENHSVQGIVKQWQDDTGNNYLTPTKIFNIYHKKKSNGLIRVYKYDPKVSSDSDSD